MSMYDSNYFLYSVYTHILLLEYFLHHENHLAVEIGCGIYSGNGTLATKSENNFGTGENYSVPDGDDG